MYDQASRIEVNMRRVTETELESLGGTSDAAGVWTFRDGSKGRFPRNPIAVYRDEDEGHEPYGFVYFEKLEMVQ